MEKNKALRDIGIAFLFLIALIGTWFYGMGEDTSSVVSTPFQHKVAGATLTMQTGDTVEIGVVSSGVLNQTASAQGALEETEDVHTSYPYMKLEKWDDASLTVSIPHNTALQPAVQGDTLVYTARESGGIDVVFYEKTPTLVTEKDALGNEYTFVINQEGGVEFDTVLHEQPESSVFVYPIETENLVFQYQPALDMVGFECTETACWDKDGEVVMFQPEMVAGSYSVYRENIPDIIRTEDEDYGTGKAFHIYRPLVVDFEGDEVWGELAIDEERGELSVSVDPTWLAQATYPVTIDPNFGYESIGSGMGGLGNAVVGSAFTMPETGTAQSITVYILQTFMSHGGITGIYRASDGVLIATTTEETMDSGWDNQWNTLTLTSNPVLTGGEEYVLAMTAFANNRIAVEYTGETDKNWYQSNGWYDTTYHLPDVLGTPSNGWQKSIYCTYTPSASLQITGSSTMSAGDSQVITITAYADGGAVDTTYTGNKNLAFWGPDDAPDGTVATVNDIDIAEGVTNVTLNFTLGVATTTLKAYKAETFALEVSDGTLTSAEGLAHDLDVTVARGAIDSLTFVQQPADVNINTNFSSDISVEMKDAYDNPITGSRTVEVLFDTNPGAATLVGTTSYVTTTGGVTFADLSVDKGGAGYVLLASTTGATTTSDSFRVYYALANVPTGLSVEKMSDTEAQATWLTDGNGNGIEYYCEAPINGKNSGWVASTTTSWSATGLSCGEQYFHIKARNEDGVETVYSAQVQVVMANCSSSGGGGSSSVAPSSETTTADTSVAENDAATAADESQSGEKDDATDDVGTQENADTTTSNETTSQDSKPASQPEPEIKKTEAVGTTETGAQATLKLDTTGEQVALKVPPKAVATKVSFSIETAAAGDKLKKPVTTTKSVKKTTPETDIKTETTDPAEGSEAEGVTEVGEIQGDTNGDAVAEEAVPQQETVSTPQSSGPPAPSVAPISAQVYEFTASNDEGGSVTQFDEPVTINFSYTEEQVSQFKEDTLAVYYFDEENEVWVKIDTELDTENNQATININHFTTFVIMGEKKEGEEETVVSTMTFLSTLRRGMVHLEVLHLQRVLNLDPDTQVAEEGPGSPGQETDYFGPLTESAVIRFQEKYRSDILTPWELERGTGLVGKTTREKLNELSQ